MKIYGLQKLTLLDYPGKIAATVFTGGCNFRCPFCHNASLVTKLDSSSIISEEDFFSFLDKRAGMLEGVCVSGGEPTLNGDLPEFISRIKARGFKVKLDTNGYSPSILSTLIDGGLVDYVAMDIKNCKEKYASTAGCTDLDISKIERSAEILMKKTVDFEFRTTVVRELHTEDDIRKIGEWLRGGERFFLQSFIDSGDLIKCGLNGYDKNTLSSLLKVLKSYIPNAELRGI